MIPASHQQITPQQNRSAPSTMVVAKFGGTSVADFDAMSHSADVVLSNPDVRLVILSASAGITNLLVALADGCEPEKRELHLADIRRIQYDILTKLGNPVVIRDEIDCMLENMSMLSEAASLATSAALTDELVSHGELMSTLLFVELIRQRQVAVEWFDVRKIMRTNDRFGRAEPDTQLLSELAQTQLAPRIAQAIVVTQGFIGSESKGRTTTLGRGGSDYTAALLGEALNVSRIDIWTDVPGIYSTDPRVVPGAKRIDKIAFEEAAEMATFGAKVLHPATLLPAVRSDIPVFVGSSKDPAAGGTLVCNETENPPLFRALALRRKQTLLTLHSLNMLHARGFLAEVFNILARHNISVDLITTSEVSVALTLDTTGSTSTAGSLLTTSLLTELSSLCRVEVEEDLALVAIIGNNLSQACGVGKEVFGVLDPFNIRMICYGASSHNLCFLVPGHDAEKVVQTLHHNLFEL
ncbi:lysine-sensitive aspartokinase 3 [Yersinia aldovae]|uniref:lysine-sensitive aspartokinase 3 n=1 Tax=Yersinia aldovae TaxID=29483 RepID=UPI001643E887|nr:lysine-sensitive aspartokinase 3 [Yersinia aldovae]